MALHGSFLRCGLLVIFLLLLGLILDTVSGRSPLYRPGEFFTNQGTALLLGKAVAPAAFQDDTVGVKNANGKQFLALRDHLQNCLGLFRIADPHRVIDTALDCLQEEFGPLPRGSDKLCPLSLQIQESKDADAERQQSDGDYDDL